MDPEDQVEPRPPTAAETEAFELLKGAAYELGKRFHVCPVCLVLNLATWVEDGIEADELAHGIPPHGETMQ